MTKNTLFAAFLVSASGLGASQALAQAPCVSSQPNHSYTLSMVPLDKVIQTSKRAYIADGISTMVYANGLSSESAASPDKCEGASPTYVIYTTKTEFDRVRAAGKGKIAVSTDPTFESSGSGTRACLDVPVVRNRVQRIGENEIKITFTLDEDAQMKAKRLSFIGVFNADKNKDVLCYRVNPGKINMTVPVPRTPEAPVNVSPQAGMPERAKETPTLFKFFAPLFGQ